METPIEQTNHNGQAIAERPDFLKIICILSFVSAGLWILIYSLGSLCLALGQGTIEKIWPQIVQGNPQMEEVDAVEFFRQFGWLSVYSLFANIFSLIGITMMWRLEKVGFYIYVAAELLINFIGMAFDMGQKEKSYGGLIFFLVIDLIFIALYFVNLKHMKGKKQATEMTS